MKNLLLAAIDWIAQIFRWVAKSLGWIFAFIFGKFNWVPPKWLRAVGVLSTRTKVQVGQHPGRASLALTGVLGLIVAGYAAWHWYQAQPKPVEYDVKVDPIERTCVECSPPGKPQAAVVHFSGSVAPLKDSGKVIDPDKAGFTLRPVVAGEWRWSDDKTLLFTPKADWPVGQKYSLEFSQRGFTAPQVRLSRYEITFTSPAFNATIDSTEFYQDPVVAADKKIVTTFKFSQPVDPTALERRLSLKMFNKVTNERETEAQAPAFTVTYDKFKLHAYVHTAQLPMLPKGGRVALELAKGVHAARGGNETQEALNSSVSIPGLYSLQVNDLRLTIARDERDNPSQALVIATSHSITELEMVNHVKAWILPLKHPDPQLQADWEKNPPKHSQRAFVWNATLVTPTVLASSTPVELHYVTNEREHVEVHSFALKAEPNRQIYAQIDKGLRSFGGYLMPEPQGQVLKMPEYPKEVRIAFKGALLALSGPRKILLFTRDVPALKVQVGRLLPDQLQHLVTQSGGDFASPSFSNNEFNDANITERFTNTVAVAKLPAGTANYQALDIVDYMNKPGTSRQGIFLLNVQAYDPVHKRAIDSGAGDGSTSDTRLVVVTDLGLLAKKSVDGSWDVFVQSIATGEPVAGASIEVVSRNGETVQSETSDAEGHAHFKDMRSFKDEREPVLYLAKHGSDSSFLPIKAHIDVLDLSRFDVGGVSNKAEHAALSAFVFSDRGIYRPGDEIRGAAIVKTQDWHKLPEGLPLRVEISDPRGLTVKRELIHLSAAGFEEIRYQTRDNSPAGNYTVNVYVVKTDEREDLMGSMTVKVQEFLPDRLRMTTHFSVEQPDGWVSPDKLQAEVNLENLFGTPAADRRVQASLRLSPAALNFPRYRDYEFKDPQVAKEGFAENLSDRRTGVDGKTTFDLNLSRFARATYRVSLVVQGFEADGGRGVTSEAAQLVSSLPFLVGWKADGRVDFVPREGARSVDLLAIDQKLKPVAAAGLRLKRLERRFVSVLLKQDSGIYKYESRLKEIPIDEHDLRLPGGNAHIDLDTKTPGNFSYIVNTADGQSYARIDYTVAGAANLSRSLDKNAELQIVLDKHDYAPGDTISMQIQAPYIGAGLITIERDHVYSWQWFKTTTSSSIQKIKVPQGLEGNGYVSVSFVRNPTSEEIYTAPLSYGVQPFSIALDARRNAIQLSAPGLIKPGQKMVIGYKTTTPARMALFAVDEGILQVARYKTPDPLGHFFQKRSLDVTTRQILDLILPEFRASMLSAPGGDKGSLLGANLNPFRRKTDLPVAWWSGIVDASNTQKELSLTVPDYFNGRLKIIAIAVNDGSIGVAEQASVVRADFVLSPNAPLTVSPGDEFNVSVGVANNVVGSGVDAAVTVKIEPSAHFEVLGASQSVLKITEMRESSANFRIRTRDDLGSGSLRFVASLGAKNAQLATSVSVRPAVSYMNSLLAGSFKGSTQVPITRTLYPHYRTLKASISTLPLALAHGLSGYLERYPYSCTEQLVSQAMPAIVLSRRPEFGNLKVHNGASLASMIDELRSRQTGDGSFRYWAGGTQSFDFVSVYALHVLIEASERGEAVPKDLLDAGRLFLTRLARRDGESLADERTAAYAIYLLARLGVVVSNEAAALQKRVSENYEKVWTRDITAAYLAGAYQLMKQESLANQSISHVAFGASTEVDRWHKPMARDAMLLYLLAKHFPDRLSRLPDSMLDTIVSQVQAGAYDSLSAATTLLALDAYATATNAVASAGPPKFGIQATLADKSTHSLTVPMGLFPAVDLVADTVSVNFTSDAAVRSFYLVNQSGFDRSPITPILMQGLEITREFLNSAGKAIDHAKVGDEVTVHIKFRSIDRESIDDAVLVDLLPGGFDLVVPNAPPPDAANWAASPESGSGSTEQGAADAEGVPAEGVASGGEAGAQECACLFLASRPEGFPDFADLREDRVVLYGKATNKIQEFSYHIKATNAGAYTVPSAYGESMYSPLIHARSAAGKIVVSPP